MRVRGCEMDIIPADIYQKLTGKSFQEAGLKPTRVQTTTGEVVGALVRAEAFNPPVGCYRVVIEDSFRAA